MKTSAAASIRAFTPIELMVVIAILAILAALLLPGLANSDRAERAIDRNNVRQTLVATHMYSTENNDHLPHPTWGTVSADPGPDGWAYATKNNGRFPGLPPQIPSAFGLLTNTNQLPWFERGLLGPYLAKDQKLLDCPKDIRQRSDGRFLTLYSYREMKLTSYSWNGAVCGYGSGRQVPNAYAGATYKLTGFKGTDFLMWEVDEWVTFNFNDAGQNPTNPNEAVSKRHAGGSPYPDLKDLGGGAIVGRFDTSAHFVKWDLFRILRNTGAVGNPNELLCGPGYR